MAIKFLPSKDWSAIGIHIEPEHLAELDHSRDKAETMQVDDKKQTALFSSPTPAAETTFQKEFKGYDTKSDAPTCSDCGGMMTRSGTCYKCMNCGSTSGCS